VSGDEFIDAQISAAWGRRAGSKYVFMTLSQPGGHAVFASQVVVGGKKRGHAFLFPAGGRNTMGKHMGRGFRVLKGFVNFAHSSTRFEKKSSANR